MDTKICNKCKVGKAPGEFYKDKSMKDGRKSRCKECFESYRNAVHVKERNKAYAKGYMRDYMAAYRKTPRAIERYNRWIESEERKEYIKDYNASRRGKLIQKTSSLNHSAKKRGANEVVTAEEVDKLFELYPSCLCCGGTSNIGIDHIIPLSRGGRNIFDNLQVLCSPCNMRKYISSTDYRP